MLRQVLSIPLSLQQQLPALLGWGVNLLNLSLLPPLLRSPRNPLRPREDLLLDAYEASNHLLQLHLPRSREVRLRRNDQLRRT